ncbi:MAG: cyclic nucleotide-binding domain-containing protein [Desulfarculaceae bacterium]|nr:cyclic nucleotide-binding domain-containing protein [Desulfarculaceae bacterium]
MVKIQDLKRITLFSDMPDDLLQIIAARANLSIFSTDTHLFEANEDIDTFYMLLMGQVALKVELTEDIDIILDTVQTGSSFGVSALLEGTRTTSAAICQEPCEVITLSGRKMLELFSGNPKLGYHVMYRLAGHYKHIMDNTANRIMKTMDRQSGFHYGIEDYKNLAL